MIHTQIIQDERKYWINQAKYWGLGENFIDKLENIGIVLQETHFFPLAAGAETTSVADGEREQELFK